MVSMAGILHLRQTAVHSCGNGLRDSKGGISSSIAFRFVLSQHEDSGLIFEDSANCIEAEIPERGQFSCTVVPLDEWRRAGCGRALSLPDLPFGIPRNQIVFATRHRFYIHRSTISGTPSNYCGSGPSELDPLRFWSRIMFKSIKTAIIAATASTAPITVIFIPFAPIARLFRTWDMRNP